MAFLSYTDHLNGNNAQIFIYMNVLCKLFKINAQFLAKKRAILN